MSPSQPENSTSKFYKGDIAKIYAWDRALSPEEVSNMHKDLPQEGLTINVDFNDEKTYSDVELFNTHNRVEDIRVPNSIIPHRVEGRMRCLPHPDEGIVDGVFTKGETTARNERRYVLEMQKGSWDYKGDGIKQVKYKQVGEKVYTPWAKMIDIEL